MKKIFLYLFLFVAVTSNAKTSINVSFMHEGLMLNGRLMLPDASGPQPVIIIAPGTGANDRNATVFISGGNFNCLYPSLVGDTLRPYLGLSEALSDSGYAVFTFDKLEYTYPNPGTITFNKLWMQVRSAIDYLKTRSDIDVNKMVILGHSEGSSLAPYITRTEPAVKALISLAGPRRPLDTLLAYQIPYIAHTCGGDTNIANLQAAQILQYFGDVRTGNFNSTTPPFAGVPPAIWKEYFMVVDSVAHHYNLASRPTLFIGLGDDFNVPPATEFSRFQTEVTIPADFYLLPGINHFLTTANHPAVPEVLTDTIIHWLRNQMPLTVKSVSASADYITVNISQGKLTVSSKAEQINTVSVLDLAGRLVIQRTVNSKDCLLDMEGLPASVYIIDVATGHTRKRVKLSTQ